VIVLGVRLKNIRSYRDEVIVFPRKGITAIYGDIGTGKTTILTSISYALFGQQSRTSNPIERYAYPRAEDLLRRGARQGSVKVLIMHKGKLVVVERGIAREGERFRDTGGILAVYESVGDEWVLKHYRSYSATELRSKVLEVLGISELMKGGLKPLVFANAIYVPQFNIPEVMNLAKEDRDRLINTALGIEKYTNIKKNIEEIAGGRTTIIGSRILELESIEKQLRHKLEKVDISELERLLQSLEEKKASLREKLSQVSTRLEEVRSEIRELEEKLNRLMSIHGKLASERNVLEKMKRELSEKERDLEKYLSELGVSSISELDSLQEKLVSVKRELEVVVNKLRERVKSLETRKDELVSSREKLEEQEQLLLSKKGELVGTINQVKKLLSSKEKEFEEVKALVKKGVCPVCRQKIHPSHVEKLENAIKREIASISAEIKSLEENLDSIESELEGIVGEKKAIDRELKSIDSELRATREEIDRKLSALNDILEKSSRIDRIKELLSDIGSLRSEISVKERIARELEAVEKEIREVEEKMKDTRKKESDLLEELINLEKSIAGVDAEIRSTRDKIREAREMREELNRVTREKKKYEAIRDFLRKTFIDIIDQVEAFVRAAVYESFREIFINYFNRLMEDHEVLLVDLDKDFTPRIYVRINNSLHEIPQPSGGQLISVSLAYRLALNTVIRRMNRELRDSSLILDEPTEGFSPERVEKLRRLLREIGGRDAKQIVVVTHDRNLMEIGDCRIKLSIDPSRMETRIEYEACSEEEISFDEYRRFVELLLREKIKIGMVQEKVEVREKFEPRVERVSGERARRSKRSLLDYIG